MTSCSIPNRSLSDLSRSYHVHHCGCHRKVKALADCLRSLPLPPGSASAKDDLSGQLSFEHWPLFLSRGMSHLSGHVFEEFRERHIAVPVRVGRSLEPTEQIVCEDPVAERELRVAGKNTNSQSDTPASQQCLAIDGPALQRC